jgi:acyl-CoA thioester hydrolase
MSEAPITYRGTVYPWHCDHMGHMNVMWYVGKFDEASWQLFARLGLTPAALRESGRGMAAVEQQIAYRRELVAGDLVCVHTRVIEVRDKVLRFVHEMVNESSGEIAATTTLTAVHLDTQARRATAFTPAVREQALALCADPSARSR